MARNFLFCFHISNGSGSHPTFCQVQKLPSPGVNRLKFGYEHTYIQRPGYASFELHPHSLLQLRGMAVWSQRYFPFTFFVLHFRLRSAVINLKFGGTVQDSFLRSINWGQVVYSVTFGGCLYPLLMHKFISLGLIRQYQNRISNKLLLF